MYIYITSSGVRMVFKAMLELGNLKDDYGVEDKIIDNSIIRKGKKIGKYML